MSQGSNKAQAISIGISLIPSLIQSVEDYFGAGTGPDKKAAVMGAVSAVASGVVGAVAANNSSYRNIISALIDAFVFHRKAAGSPVQSELPTAA